MEARYCPQCGQPLHDLACKQCDLVAVNQGPYVIFGALIDDTQELPHGETPEPPTDYPGSVPTGS